MTDVWTLIERYDLARRMAADGMTIGDIVEATGISYDAARCIKQRVSPDFEDMTGLRKTTREKVE